MNPLGEMSVGEVAAYYYHWKDRQCLHQAIMVATDAEVDMEEVERWSRHEGMAEEFERIKELLKRTT